MNYERYASPFSWRYGCDELRALFSEAERRRLWRVVWVALAEAQSQAGLVSAEELADLRAHAREIDVDAALEIERETHHDLVAEIRLFASQARIGGGRIHLGATSYDVEDTVETYRMRRALSFVGARLRTLLARFAQRVRQYADLACMGFTHLQPAEPTTVGYRLAIYAQDLVLDFEHLRFVYDHLRAKGLRGAVGTSASYEALLRGGGASEEMERRVLEHFGIEARDAGSQVYSRSLDYLVLSALAALCASLSKFAADVRILSAPPFGEWAEPFAAGQVGSSAMPFKRNPVLCERIDSLARLLPAYADVAWQNAANNYLERTLDDSANRRTILPEAFLGADEVVSLAYRVIDGLHVEERRVVANLRTYGAFAGSEAVMMEAARAGGDRQRLHEAVRRAAMVSWEALERGEDNPLPQLLTEEPELTARIDPAEIRRLLDPSGHVGTAPARARRVAERIDALGGFPEQPEVRA
ncbi:MAG TPA: adenylosuccinate lyase [Candidatus Tyrphobacter sp.]